MRILVTGSAGHLGEALMRTLRVQGRAALGLDIVASDFTDVVGSIVDRECVRRCMQEVDGVLHTATLHKPHVATHSRQEFVDTNISGTLNLLEAAHVRGMRAFVFTSTTSTFGDAMAPGAGQPAVWINEEVPPISKNIYGASKLAAEDLCQLFARNQGLACVVLRTSRFFPEPDDDPALRAHFADGNIKLNELLYRRADISDLVDAHLLALERAQSIGFGRYVLSAPSPFSRSDLQALRSDAPAAPARYFPRFQLIYSKRGWHMFPGIDRVYDSALACRELGWKPVYDFARGLQALEDDQDPRSPIARVIGIKGYHAGAYADGIYPIEA